MGEFKIQRGLYMLWSSMCVFSSRERKADTISPPLPVFLQCEQQVKVMGHMGPPDLLKGKAHFLLTSFLTQDRTPLCRVA